MEYNCKNISLIDLLTWDYTFLKEKFIIKEKNVLNNSHYVNNFNYEGEIIYPFSLKESYHKLVERGINITISNYYYEK